MTVGSILLDLLGGVSLLLWGLHMVHSGIVRAVGADLRRVLGVALRDRVRALAAGAGVTALLQSSTATALMTTSLAAGGLVPLVPALAVMLGAGIGTALVVQVLAFDLSAAAPVLLAVGVLMFRRGRRTMARDLGRCAIGLGLMLLALHVLLQTLAPAEEAPAARAALNAVMDLPLINVLIGALLAWAAHSSVAVVLLTMSLAGSNFIDPAAAIAMVLGANLGSALNPVLEAGGGAAARRLSVGSLAARALGCMLVLPFVGPLGAVLPMWLPDPTRQVAVVHLGFNVGLALLFLGLLTPYSRLLARLFPDDAVAPDPANPRYLDSAALDTPALALAGATRETLRLGDLVAHMLADAMTALMSGDRKLVQAVSAADDTIDRLHQSIKLYVVKVTRDSLEEAEGRRAMEIISFAINLEHIGDIVDNNLLELASKKIKRRLVFSDEGASELNTLHEHLQEDLKLALAVLVAQDPKVARELLARKERFRQIELATAEAHFDRLREARRESVESSTLHLDALRDLARIHSHICAAAVPVREAAGELPARREMGVRPDRAAARG
jgi:phosphate:Na+ symporter